MDPTDSTLIQSRVAVAAKLPSNTRIYFKPCSTMRDQEEPNMPVKTLRKRKETYTAGFSQFVKC